MKEWGGYVVSIYESEAAFVRRVETTHTGGGVMVDVVHLDDGSVLTVSDDSVFLRRKESDLDDDDGSGEHYVGCINRPGDLDREEHPRYHENDLDDLGMVGARLRAILAPYDEGRAEGSADSAMLRVALELVVRVTESYAG